jgi:uncharacterized tellurite resistance protein B-like protein
LLPTHHPYHLGLLCLTHLLISADGVVDNNEVDALQIIKKRENISHEVFTEFEKLIATKGEREIFQLGIELINHCSTEEKIRVFVMLYKLSEVDGRVHIKEIRLLLYSIKLAGVEFNDVVNRAVISPPLF